MVQKISPSLPQRIFSSVLPEHNIDRIALLILGGIVFLYAVRTLVGRVFPSDDVRNREAQKCYDQGRDCALQQEFEEAKRQYLKALSWKPPKADLLARIHIGFGRMCFPDHSKAIDHFNQALSIQTEDMSIPSYALMYRGETYGFLKHYDTALQDLKQALSCNEPSTKAEILLLMSRVYCLMDNHLEAMKKYEEAFQCEGDLDECLQTIVDLSNMSLEKNYEQSIKYLDLALRLMGETRDDNYADVLRHRAKVYRTGDKVDNSLEDLNKALGCSFSSPNVKAQIFMDRRDLYEYRGEKNLALADLLAARDCDPTDPELKRLILSLVRDFMNSPSEIEIPD
jgi:tetratricopeptide (TPR) repeat protein